MSGTARDVRLSVVLFGERAQAALVDGRGEVLDAAVVASVGDPAADVAHVLDALGTLGGAMTSRLRAVVVGGSVVAAALLRSMEQLWPVAVVRIATPPRSALPPLAGWPAALAAAVSAGEAIVAGGRSIDGAPLAPLDAPALTAFLHERAPRARAVAITGTFSATTQADELEAARIAQQAMPGDTPIVLSQELGTLQLLERENASVLNAALIGVARRLTGTLVAELAVRGIRAPVCFLRNDGTLMPLDFAVRFPLLGYAGGRSGLLRGAAHLSGLRDALVCAVEGEGTLMGAVVAGRPRIAAGVHRIADVPTSVRFPHTFEVDIGPGTLVPSPAQGAPRTLGDVARGLAHDDLALGDERQGRSAGRAHALVRRRLEEAVERAKESSAHEPLVVVGAWDRLVPPELTGIERVVRVPHAEVAAAVGAAVAPISATAERIVARATPPEARRAEVVEAVRRFVVQGGAAPEEVELVELVEAPLPYLPNSPIRVRARAEARLAPWTA